MLKRRDQYLFVAFIPFLLASIFGLGFYHPDEHYQLLEYLNLKTGTVQIPEIFNWDFHLRIRPWFQVFQYFTLQKIFFFIKSPFTQGILFRLWGGTLGFFALYFFFHELVNDKKKLKSLILVTSYTWFIPFILCRTSSESLSASFFLFGATLFLRSRFILSGLLLGASFLCRYQMGIPILFLFLFGLFVKKISIKQLIILGLCVLMSIGQGFFFDYWGYGQWAFAPYDYFYQNLILGKSADFGVDPWWYYIKLIFIKGIPPLSLIFMVGVCYYWYKNKRSIITWVTLPFVLIHFGIAHKELRFLNFVYLLAPFMAWPIVAPWLIKRKWAVGTCIGVNLILLLKVVLTPAHKQINFYKYLYFQHTHVKTFYVPRDPNGGNHKFALPFYQRRPLKTQAFHLTDEIDEKKLIQMKNIITTRFDQYQLMEHYRRCRPHYSIYPKYLHQFNFFNWPSRSALWTYWICGP